MFLSEFEAHIIDILCKKNKDKQIMTPKEVLKVALRYQDKTLFEQYLAKGLEAALGIYSTTYGYRVGECDEKMEEKDELRKFLNMHKSKEYKQTPLVDNFQEIVTILAGSNYEKDELRAAILLAYDVCVRKELDELESDQYNQFV